MSANRMIKTQSLPLDKRAEAAVWFARLRGSDRNAEVDRGFRAWLSSDVEHARAFELLTERLESVEQLRSRSIPRHWRRQTVQTAVRWRPVFAAVAALVLVVVAALLAYPQFAGISTGIGEQRILTLKDGTRVYLNTDTRVQVHYDTRTRRVDLKEGEALFEVAKESGRPFVVYAANRQITALGTAFLVRSEQSRFSVTLVEGRIAVASQEASTSAASSILTPGQRLTVRSHERPKLDTPPLDKVIAWRQGLVALEDMPLSEAVAEMNRYSTRTLKIEQPEAYAVRVGGFFRTGDSMSFARAVASTYRFRVVERPDEIVLAGAPQVPAAQHDPADRSN